VVGAIVAIWFGTGVGAMYADQYLIAAALYAVSILLVIGKVITWEERKRQPRQVATVAAVFAMLMGVAVFLVLLSFINIRYKQTTAQRKSAMAAGVSPSPQEPIKPQQEPSPKAQVKPEPQPAVRQTPQAQPSYLNADLRAIFWGKTSSIRMSWYHYCPN
jgi:predicted PurR-regulated permease PerM